MGRLCCWVASGNVVVGLTKAFGHQSDSQNKISRGFKTVVGLRKRLGKSRYYGGRPQIYKNVKS
jgi:hypothetical protein